MWLEYVFMWPKISILTYENELLRIMPLCKYDNVFVSQSLSISAVHYRALTVYIYCKNDFKYKYTCMNSPTTTNY